VYAISSHLTNFTFTEEDGSYSINVVPGGITVFVNSVGYEYWEKAITVQEYEDYSLDIVLEKEPGG
jgi:hypothetical protein